MKRLHWSFPVLVGVFALLLASNGCKKESNPANDNSGSVEHPPATTITFVLFDSTGVTFADSCQVSDTTLVSGKPPVVGQLDLVAGKIYKGTIRLYDFAATPPIDDTPDIISEKDAHLFEYHPSDTNRVKISGLDLDSKGLTFGINFTVTVTSGAAATGTIHVILQHHDDGIKFNSDGSYHQDYDLDVDTDFPYAITP